MNALCKEHVQVEAVFRRVQWLPVSAYKALGDYIDASPEQVLSHLENEKGREFFGALVIWVHKSTVHTHMPFMSNDVNKGRRSAHGKRIATRTNHL